MSDPLKNRASNRSEKYDPLAPQARRTFAIAIITIIVAGLILAYYGYLIAALGYWQLYLTVGSLVGLIVISFIALMASRKGVAALGGWLLISGIALTLLSLSLVIHNLSNILGLAGFFAIVFVAIQTLPQTQVRWATFVGVLTLIAMTFFSFPLLQTVSILSLDRLIQWSSLLALIALVIILLLQFRSLSLTNKLIVAFLAVAIVVAYSINAFNQRSTEQALMERAGQSLNDLAITQAQAVGDLLNTQLDSLVSLALGSYLQTWVRSTNDLYIKDPQKILATLMALDKQWEESLQAGDLKSPLISKRLGNEIAEDLKEFSKVFPSNLDIILTDVYGGLIASTGLETDYYQGDEDWWLSTYNNSSGEVFISAPIYDPQQNQNFILMAVPVRDQDTQGVIGILQTRYSLSEIENILLSSNKSGGVNTDLYIPSQPPQVIQNRLLEIADNNTLNELKDLSSKSFGEANYLGEARYISQAFVKPASDDQTIERLGWWLVAYQDKSDLTLPVQRQTKQSGFLSAIILGVVSALAVFVSQYLSGPIVRLTQTAEKIRAGELTAKAEIESDDEVGKLAFTFNKMTSQLRETLHGLEQRVDERTRELALAGEVGREISQKRDLDLVLEAAVNLIQANFKLYYTQIYLVDPTGRALWLRSGYGKVGEELIRRGHRLPVGSGSINGMAAIEKHPIIVSDTSTSSFFQANPLLPKTRSEMAVPLLVGDRLVGVLDMQSEKPGNFDQDSVPVFEALAGQLAVAVENAALFHEAKQARDELESQSRNLSRSGWDDFLNAIDRGEKIGYFYNQQEIIPIQEVSNTSTNHGSLVIPLQVSGQEVGEVRLEKDGVDTWSEEEISLINGVATQVIRQIDNIRLLTQAEKYREEAELAARRLIREGWSEYANSIQKEEIGFIYDHQTVAQLDEVDRKGEEPSFTQPISVRGEELGMVELDGDVLTETESLSFVREITERLGAHIENLRLTAQTQSALLETEALYSVIAKLNSAQSYQDIFDVFSKNTIFEKADQLLLLGIFDIPLDNAHIPEWIFPVAAHSPGGIEIASRYPFSAFEAKPNTLFGEKSVTFTNLTDTHRLDRVTRTLFRSVINARSSIIVPLRLGQQMIGFIQGYFSTVVDYSEEDQQRLEAVGGQAAVAVESLRLLDETRQRNEELLVINQITGAVSRTLELDQVLEEILGRVLAITGFECGLISSVDPATKKLRLSVHRDLPEQLVQWMNLKGMDGTPCDVVYRTGQAVHVPDLLEPPQELEELAPLLPAYWPHPGVLVSFEGAKSLGFRSYLGVPLISKGNAFGTVCLLSHKTSSAPQGRIELMKAVGQQVGIAVENAELFKGTQEALGETERLYQASSELNSVQNYEDILKTLKEFTILGRADKLLSILLFSQPISSKAEVGTDKEFAFANLLEKAEWVIPIAQWSTKFGEILPLRHSMKDYPLARYLSPTAVTMIESVESDERLDEEVRRYFREDMLASSLLIAPLIVGGSWIGFLFGAYGAAQKFDEAEIRRLTALSNQAAVAVQSLTLLERAQAKAQQEQRIREVTAQIYGATDVETIMQRAVQQVSLVLGTKAYIYLGKNPVSKEKS